MTSRAKQHRDVKTRPHYPPIRAPPSKFFMSGFSSWKIQEKWGGPSFSSLCGYSFVCVCVFAPPIDKRVVNPLRHFVSTRDTDGDVLAHTIHVTLRDAYHVPVLVQLFHSVCKDSVTDDEAWSSTARMTLHACHEPRKLSAAFSQVHDFHTKT